jgi:hypothetical protein
MEKITAKTKLATIIQDEKKLEILQKYNFPCLGCPMFQMEAEILTIGDVCKNYSINQEKLLEELNKNKKD